jgi:predicted transcriptional regulator
MITMWRRVLQQVVEVLTGRPSVKEPAVMVTVRMDRHPDPDATAGLVRADAMAPVPHAVIASSAVLAPSAESEAPKEPIAAGLSERVGTPPVTAHQASPGKRRPSARGTLTEWAMVPRTDLANAIKALRSAKGVRVVEIARETGLNTSNIYRVMLGSYASAHNYQSVTDAIHAIVARRSAPLDADPGKTFRYLRVTSGVSVKQVADEADVHPLTVYRAQRGTVRNPDMYRRLSNAVATVRSRNQAPVPVVAHEAVGHRIIQSVLDFDSAMPPAYPRAIKASIVRNMRLARNLPVAEVARGLRIRHSLVEMLESGACLHLESYDAIVRRIQTVWPVLDGTPVDGTAR